MTHNLEHHGFLIFFISILMITQLRWAETYNYNVKNPLTFHGGAALLLKSINFFYELEYTDWRSLEFSSTQSPQRLTLKDRAVIP